MAHSHTTALLVLTLLLIPLIKARPSVTEGIGEGISCTCDPQPFPEEVCGSDGVTYPSLCSFMIASCKQGFLLTIENSGPCPSK